MKSILFGKKLDEAYVKSFLNSDFDCHFADLISFETLKYQAFDLQNKSLIFTSIQAVMAFEVNRFEIQNISNVFCVGTTSKIKLENLGFTQVFSFNKAQDLANELSQHNYKTTEFVYFKGNLSLKIIEDELTQHGLNYKCIDLYKTQLLYPTLKEVFPILVFFSPSGVESYAKNNPFTAEKIFALGETTAKSIKNHTDKKVYSPLKSELSSLLQLIKATA